MNDRGFDLERRVGELEATSRHHELAPTDRIAERSYFAPPPRGHLPVLGSNEVLAFGSNNYLGLTTDPRVQNAARQAAATVGTGAGASRTDCGDTIVHHDLERLLAEVKEADRGLVCASKYGALLDTIATLEPDVAFADERSSRAVFDSCQLADVDVVTYAHCDASALETALAARARRSEATDSAPETDSRRWLVVTDTVFERDGTVAPLAALCDVAEKMGALVLVDESHATGLYANGGGVVQSDGVADRIAAQVGTLGAGVASHGGYVIGSTALIDLVTAGGSHFLHATGLSPPAVAAASEALHIARHSDKRDRLWENVSHLRDGLTTMGHSVGGSSHILTVEFEAATTAREVAQELFEADILVRHVHSQPTGSTAPEPTNRLRLTPTAGHDPSDIVTCLEAFQTITEELEGHTEN